MRISILILMMLFTGVANAASVREENGDIFYVGDDGSSRKLTSRHTDNSPLLSPDGKTVVFFRSGGHRLSGETSGNEVWLADMDGNNTRRLLEEKGGESEENFLASFNTPAFSADGKWLYFLTAAWATSNALHVLDIASGKEHFVTDANDVMVVPQGKYINHLVVMKHKYFKSEDGGSYDYYWLITPKGKEIKMVGKDRKQAERFIQRQQTRKATNKSAVR